LAAVILNKFDINSYQRFPFHLNNVSTLPCDYFNFLLSARTPELIECDLYIFFFCSVWDTGP